MEYDLGDAVNRFKQDAGCCGHEKGNKPQLEIGDLVEVISIEEQKPLDCLGKRFTIKGISGEDLIGKGYFWNPKNLKLIKKGNKCKCEIERKL